MRRAWMTLVIAAAIGAGASDVAAQARSPLSLDLNVGRGIGTGHGTYLDNSDGFIGDVLLAYRLRGIGSGGLLAAFDAGIQGTRSHALVCMEPENVQCVPPFPEFKVFAAAVGWENSSGSFRAFAGPAVVHADEAAGGVFARGDVALPLFSRVWGVAGVRGVIVPDYQGDSFQLGGVSFGLRIR
ncbi:MAG TPA: hypothetical protein VFU06_01075 [Longimicrobiales bacterium]|nr:hypothetical protein [Longimicrobiales bacterium]